MRCAWAARYGRKEMLPHGDTALRVFAVRLPQCTVVPHYEQGMRTRWRMRRGGAGIIIGRLRREGGEQQELAVTVCRRPLLRYFCPGASQTQHFA